MNKQQKSFHMDFWACDSFTKFNNLFCMSDSNFVPNTLMNLKFMGKFVDLYN